MRLVAAWSAAAGTALQRFSVRHGVSGGLIESELEFNIKIEADELDGGFVAECIEFPGALAQGETEREALENVIDVIASVLELRLRDNLGTDSPKNTVIQGAHRIHRISVTG
jgi:predicted RNase H-like HicB family nuclease